MKIPFEIKRRQQKKYNLKALKKITSQIYKLLIFSNNLKLQKGQFCLSQLDNMHQLFIFHCLIT